MPKLLFDPGSVEMMEGGLVLARVLGAHSVDGGLCGLVREHCLLRRVSPVNAKLQFEESGSL